jgi:AcrR family transcriptional regulator
VQLYSVSAYYTPVDGPVKPRSTLRTEQAAATRLRILEGARRVFESRGYSGATIEDIAAESSVAVPTVYKVFTNKLSLLTGVVARTMTGADYGDAIDEQQWWKEQLQEPDPVQHLRLIARNARRLYERAGRVLEVVRSASALDPEIARIWETVSSQRVDRSRRTARRFVRRAGPRARSSVEQTALTLLSLTAPELCTTHIEMGRRPDQYERWLGDTLVATLLR